jgi:hypothetical protein
MATVQARRGNGELAGSIRSEIAGEFCSCSKRLAGARCTWRAYWNASVRGRKPQNVSERGAIIRPDQQIEKRPQDPCSVVARVMANVA